MRDSSTLPDDRELGIERFRQRLRAETLAEAEQQAAIDRSSGWMRRWSIGQACTGGLTRLQRLSSIAKSTPPVVGAAR